MARVIDFRKVDAAFQELADSDAGNSALEALNRALSGVTEVTGDLNEEEQHYLVTNLVQQRVGGIGPAVAGRDTRIASGFLIKTAVKVE